MLNLLATKYPAIRRCITWTPRLNIKVAKPESSFHVKACFVVWQQYTFAVQFPSGETKDVHFIRDETCGEDVYGRLYPGEPGIFSICKWILCPITFQRYRFEWKDCFPASFKFTMLEKRHLDPTFQTSKQLELVLKLVLTSAVLEW